MKLTLDLSEGLITAIQRHTTEAGKTFNEAVADLLRSGLTALTSVSPLVDEATLEHRREVTRKFVSGEWGVDLAGYEEGRAADRRKEEKRANARRDD
jgi:hypothetical protein